MTDDDGVAAPRRSRLRGLAGRPFHPLVAAVAIGAWVTSFGLDVLSQLSDTEWIYARNAYVVVGGGIAAGLLAAVTGLVDLLGVERGTPTFRTGVRHLVLMDVTLVLFTVSFLIRDRSDFEFHESTDPVAMALSAAGLLTLAAGAWFGSALTYRHGVGVVAER